MICNILDNLPYPPCVGQLLKIILNFLAVGLLSIFIALFSLALAVLALTYHQI